jgi:hypothetical protein
LTPQQRQRFQQPQKVSTFTDSVEQEVQVFTPTTQTTVSREAVTADMGTLDAVAVAVADVWFQPSKQTQME